MMIKINYLLIKLNFPRSLSLLSISFLMFLAPIIRVEAQGILWTNKKPMSIPRTDFGVAVLNDKIYAIGGFSGSTLSLVEEYDPSSDTWTKKANMPTARRLLTITTVKNKIYAIGGMIFTDPNNVTYSKATEVYDPLTDTWSSKSDIPLPPAFNSVLGNMFYSGASANGKIYLFIFSTTLPGSTATYEYDPDSDIWTTNKSPIPFTQTKYSVTSLNDKIYVLASEPWFVQDYVKMVEYDPLIDIWIIKPSTTTKRRLLGLTAVGNNLYAIGGLTANYPGTALNTVEEFDLAANNWSLRTPMPTARHSVAMCAIGTKVYVIGGADANFVPLSVNEEGTVTPIYLNWLPMIKRSFVPIVNP